IWRPSFQPISASEQWLSFFPFFIFLLFFMSNMSFSFPAKVALYDSISPSVKLLEYCLQYAWKKMVLHTKGCELG
ncbi:MAG: hypothetical protein J7K12_03130, partial [Thermoplasmata archaeon]|nr:hypothetical protein [Thermoplasmata archaeon]